MGNPPLVALEGKPPNIESYDQMQGAALNRRLGQADLQGQNLKNQEMLTILRGNQSMVAAQHDESWDPSDPDQVVKLFKKYQVPLNLQSQGMQAITAMKSSIMNQSKESLAELAEAHANFDDQFQGLASVPDDSKQKAYQQVLTNQRNYVARLPNGPVKAQANQEIDKAPPLYDENYIRAEHALLRTQQFLTEEALKKSQAAQAAGKGAQATAESNLFAAQLPGAQAESTIKGFQAGMLQGGAAPVRQTLYNNLDKAAPPTGATAGTNTRARAKIDAALDTGDLPGARKAVDDASAEIAGIEKETNPALLQFKTREAANKAAVEQAVKNGSAEDAGRMLQQRIVAPSEIAARSNPAFLVKAIQSAQKSEPGFDAAKVEADFSVAKAPQNANFFGSANSLTNKGGTLDQLEAQYKKLPKDLGRQFPLLNSIQDYRSYQMGDPAMAGFKQTALAAADDYAKVIGGGTGSDSSRLEFMQAFSHAHSEAGFKAAIDAARAGVGSQQDARIGSNPILKNMYGGGTAAARTQTGGATVKMKAPGPNGQIKEVPADHVDHYKSKGAVIVQ